jgi:hypothetical protein
MTEQKANTSRIWDVVEADRLLYSSGRIDGRQSYIAFRIGGYGPDSYPWLLVRDDGYRTRVTNAKRCMQIADLLEEHGVTCELPNGQTQVRLAPPSRKEISADER